MSESEFETTTPPRPRPPRVNRRALRQLREPIPAHNIAKKPRVYCWACKRADEERPGYACEDHVVRWCNTCRSSVSNAHDHDDYVGHAEVTDRFLEADLLWNWEAMALDERGLPAFDNDGGLWIWLTIGGVRRPGYGHANGKTGGAAVTEAVSNALKNAGIRFGVGLNQRAQTDLHAVVADQEPNADPGQPGGVTQEASAPPAQPQYAHPDWIARVGSLLARKHGAYGEDRPRILSEILEREITDVATLSPAEARDAVRILSGGPDLNPPSPATAAEPDPAAAPPPTEPTPTPDPPQPSPRRAAPARRTSKPSQPRPGTEPAAPGPGEAHIRAINSLLNSRGVSENDTTTRLGIVGQALGRAIGTIDEVSKADAEVVIRHLGSGEVPVDQPPAAAPPADHTAAADVDEFNVIAGLIDQAVSDDDAVHIKQEIGKRLMAGRITKGAAADLYERLEERGRLVGAP